MKLTPEFVGSDIERIAPKIEEWIRKEVNASAPIPYEIEVAAARSTTFSDLLSAGLGGSLDEIHRLAFELPLSRPTSLRVSLMKRGVASVVGSLLYSTELSKSIDNEVFIKDLGWGKFEGDTAAAQKLNANRELVKQANKFIQEELSNGNLTFKVPGYFGLRPHESKSILIAKTLLQRKMFSLNFGVDKFNDIASIVDATL